MGQDSSGYLSHLTDLEQSLFHSVYRVAARRLAWQRRKADLLLPDADAYSGTSMATSTSGGVGGGNEMQYLGPATMAEAELLGASLPKSRGQKRTRSMMLSST
jgi:hypothetical protein